MTMIDNGFSDQARGKAASAPLTPFEGLSHHGLDRVRQMYAALAPTRDTLAVLFSLQAAQTEPSDAWVNFFIEIASDFLIWDERPTGFLSESNAQWVLARFDDAPSLAVLGLMVRLLDEAHHLPIWFLAAVRQRAALFMAETAASASPRKRSSHLRLVS